MCYTGKCKHEGYMGDCIAIMENGNDARVRNAVCIKSYFEEK